MTKNLDYARIYSVYMNLPHFAKNGDANKAIFWADAHFTPFYNEAIKEYYVDRFTLHPGEHFNAEYALRRIGEKDLGSIRKDYQEKAMAMAKQRIKQAKILEKLLDEMAPQVEIIAQEKAVLLKVVPITAFAMMKHQAPLYAKGALFMDKDLITMAGFKAQIIQNIQNGNFELWANIDLWQLDAIWRKNTPSLLYWAKICLGNNLDPRVYNPDLPDDVYRKAVEHFS